MSLASAVIEIAEAMENTSNDFRDMQDKGAAVAIMAYAKMIRVAVSAAEGGQSAAAKLLSPETQHITEIEKAKEEIRKKKLKQQDAEPVMIMANDGPLQGTYVPADPAMPIGAKTSIDGMIYELRDGGLFHVPKQEQSDTVTS